MTEKESSIINSAISLFAQEGYDGTSTLSIAKKATDRLIIRGSIMFCRFRYSLEEFIRCFHQFVSQFFSINFSNLKQLKNKTSFL